MSSLSWCSIGKREERQKLVSAYIRCSSLQSIPNDIQNMILTFYDTVAYWDFKNAQELEKFYSLQYKEVLFGPKISFGPLVFQCTLCPSGWSHKGCVQFYIEFDKESMNNALPKCIKSIVAYLVIYCAQIEYEYRTPKIFINIESAQGWPAYRIDDIRLNEFETLNFGCYIELLKVEYYDTPLGIDKYPFWIDKHEMSAESECKWIVSDDLLRKFKAAKYSNGFYSPNFDNDSWCLSCSPFGIKKEYNGKFCIALKILRLPWNKKSIKVKHSIVISSDDGKFKVDISDIKQFDYHRKASRFTKEVEDIGTFEHAKCLTFVVKVLLIDD